MEPKIIDTSGWKRTLGIWVESSDTAYESVPGGITAYDKYSPLMASSPSMEFSKETVGRFVHGMYELHNLFRSVEEAEDRWSHPTVHSVLATYEKQQIIKAIKALTETNPPEPPLLNWRDGKTNAHALAHAVLARAIWDKTPPGYIPVFFSRVPWTIAWGYRCYACGSDTVDYSQRNFWCIARTRFSFGFVPAGFNRRSILFRRFDWYKPSPSGSDDLSGWAAKPRRGWAGFGAPRAIGEGDQYKPGDPEWRPLEELGRNLV